MHVTVTWEHDLAFQGASADGLTLPLDCSPEVGGQGAGFGPKELILLGLAGCTGMDAISILRKKRQDVTGYRVDVRARSDSEHPKVFVEVEVVHVVRGRGVDPAAVDRAIELSITKYCPVQAMLSPKVPIRHRFQVIDEEPV